MHSKGPKTPRSFIKVLYSGAPPRFPEKGSGRLQLADWIASKDNPLTARVYANRVWHHLFGRGIVSNTDNFGHTGQAPSNQSLLDHLAISFIEDGWSTKNLIRRIVLSRVYQLGSTSVSGVQEELDLQNKLFWRQNRRRGSAPPGKDCCAAPRTRQRSCCRPPGGKTAAPDRTGARPASPTDRDRLSGAGRPDPAAAAASGGTR